MPDQDPDRIPVIVGVGQINDRPEQPGDGLDPVGLMAEALRRADADANAGRGLLADCDSLAVVAQLGWPQLNPVDEKVVGSVCGGQVRRPEVVSRYGLSLSRASVTSRCPS